MNEHDLTAALIGAVATLLTASPAILAFARKFVRVVRALDQLIDLVEEKAPELKPEAKERSEKAGVADELAKRVERRTTNLGKAAPLLLACLALSLLAGCALPRVELPGHTHDWPAEKSERVAYLYCPGCDQRNVDVSAAVSYQQVVRMTGPMLEVLRSEVAAVRSETGLTPSPRLELPKQQPQQQPQRSPR